MPDGRFLVVGAAGNLVPFALLYDAGLDAWQSLVLSGNHQYGFQAAMATGGGGVVFLGGHSNHIPVFFKP